VATKRRNEEKSLSTESGKIKESSVKARKTVYRPKTEKRRVQGKYNKKEGVGKKMRMTNKKVEKEKMD